MAKNIIETVVGAFVVIAAVVFLVFMSGSFGMSSSKGTYKLTASFRSADGVSIGTDVRMAGVKIGIVKDLFLDPKSFRANVMISLRDDLNIPDDSAIMVSQDGLLGGTYIEIVPGGSDFNMKPNGEFMDTQGSISLISLLLKFVAGS